MRWRECTATAYQEPPSARLGHSAVLVDARASWGEELLVVYGGLNGDKQPLGDLAVLQTASEAWFHPTTANAGPPPRAFHCAAAVGGRLFVFGGHVYVKETKGMQKYNDLWCLNTDNWEWSEVRLHADSPRPSPRDFLDMVALPGGQLLLFGGLEAAEKRSDETWLFDCASASWAELQLPAPRPRPRFAHRLALLDQRVLLCGGCGETATSMLNDLWLLKGVLAPEDAEPCWVPLELPGTPPTPRKAHALAVAGAQVVVFGGHHAELGWFRSKQDTYHADVSVLERAGAVRWAAPAVRGDAPAGREFHSLTAVSPRRLLMFGGGNGKAIFADAWWLCLDEDAPSPRGLAPPADAAAKAVPASSEAALAGSHMSEASGADQCLEETAHLASTRDRAVGAAGAEASGVSSHWWSGSGADSQFEAMLQRLRVPSEAAERPATSPPAQRSPEGLGQQQPQADAAARQGLLACPGAEALRLGECGALVADYRRLCLGRPAAASLAALQQRVEQPGALRFCHLQAADLRLGDLPGLLAAYQQLAAGRPGE